jgi:hypothetical protein
MGGTDGGRRYAVPLRVVPALGQLPENDSESPAPESGDVLDHNPSGRKRANDPRELAPEPGVRPADSGSPAGEGEVGAGEATGDQIDLRSAVADRPDVVVAGDLRPVVSEDRAAVSVHLSLPTDLHSGPLEAEIETTNPAEEAADTDQAFSTGRLSAEARVSS